MKSAQALLPTRIPALLRSDTRRDPLAPVLLAVAAVVGLLSLLPRWAHYDDPAGIEPSVVVEGVGGILPAYAAIAAAGVALIALLMVGTRIDRRLLALLPLLPAWLLFEAVRFLAAQSATPGVALDSGFLLPLVCVALLAASAVASFLRR